MKKLLLLILSSIVMHPVFAEIYQCVNDKGEIIFKDSQCKTNETFMKKIDSRAVKSYSKPDIQANPLLGKNLLKNSNFENQLVDWHVPLGVSWTRNGGKNGSAGFVIQADKPPQDRYIHETTASQCVLLTEATKFTVSADVHLQGLPEKNTANRINVIWYESANCSTGGQWASYLQPKPVSGWQHLERKNLTPALGAKAVKITIVQNGRFSSNGKAYWDNVRFYPSEIFKQSLTVKNIDTATGKKYTLKPGENYIRNGDFNKNISGWRIGWKTQWSSLQGDLYPGAAKVTSDSPAGGKGRHAMMQCVNLGTNRKFILGASFKTGAGSSQLGSGRLRLDWHQGLNCSGRSKIDAHWRDPTYIAGWQKLQIKGLQAPANAQSATIEIIQSVKGAGRFIAYWDDIYFIATE